MQAEERHLFIEAARRGEGSTHVQLPIGAVKIGAAHAYGARRSRRIIGMLGQVTSRLLKWQMRRILEPLELPSRPKGRPSHSLFFWHINFHIFLYLG